MTTIHVAVVIVTYRTAELTIDCLKSIEPERHGGNLRITAVVIDNSSEDASAVKRSIDENGWASWASVACAPKNGGFAYGNNLGVRLSENCGIPDYIHLLNPDTVLRSGAITSLVEFLETNLNVGIAGSSFENLDGSDWPIAFRYPTMISEIEEGLQLGIASRLLEPWIVARTMTKSAQMVDWIPGASMMVRKSVFDAIGGLDEGYFLYFEETDFCFRALKKGFPTWYVPASRVMHIAGQSTKVTERSTTVKRMPGYWFESRRRFFLSSYGLRYSILTDVFAIFAGSLGAIKRVLLRQTSRSIPFFLSDLVRHSVLWPKNRKFTGLPSPSQ